MISSYEAQLLRHGVRQIFVILYHFLPFSPPLPNNPENQHFEKMKKVSGNIILNLCNKKHDQMMYTQIWSATDIVFCHLKPFFCSFALLLTFKIKIWKKCKTSGDNLLLPMCTISQDHMMYGS